MNTAEIDNHNAAVEAREYRERMNADKSADNAYFRGMILPPPGERQALKGLMRTMRQRKRLEAEARKSQSDAATSPSTGPVRTSRRKANRDERRAAQVDTKAVSDTSADGSYG